MISAAVSRRAAELAAARAAFVNATVVRARRPTSAHAGDAAIVLSDGTIEGFVGGSCAEHSVRVYALAAIESGEPLLLRIVPFDGVAAASSPEEAAEEVSREEGVVTVQNPCLSGGEIEVFLEPVLPAPHVVVAGETPIAEALRRLAREGGFEAIAEGAPLEGAFGVVIASHGRDELALLRAALEADVPYVGLVASRARGSGVIAELRSDGVAAELLESVDVPAGIDIGARTPSEVAVSIVAKLIAARRQSGRSAPRAGAVSIAVDPICGMTVATAGATVSLEYDGERYFFCCEGCRSQFEARRHAGAGA